MIPSASLQSHLRVLQRCAPCKAWRFFFGESPNVINLSQESLPSVAFMLAKPWKEAEGGRVTNTINTAGEADGGTARAKRTQGSWQAAGRFAPSSRLIQPRKQLGSGGRPGNVTGKAASVESLEGEMQQAPSGSNKIVACRQRSVENELGGAIGATRAPRTREASPPFLSGNRRVIDVQLWEGINGSGVQSHLGVTCQAEPGFSIEAWFYPMGGGLGWAVARQFPAN